MQPINETVQPVNPAMPTKRRVTTLTVGSTKLLLPEGFPQSKLCELLETLGEAQVIDYQYTAKGSIYFPAGDVEITAGIQSLYIVESAEAAHRIGGTL
jgi:hypothetical protein